MHIQVDPCDGSFSDCQCDKGHVVKWLICYSINDEEKLSKIKFKIEYIEG